MTWLTKDLSSATSARQKPKTRKGRKIKEKKKKRKRLALILKLDNYYLLIIILYLILYIFYLIFPLLKVNHRVSIGKAVELFKQT